MNDALGDVRDWASGELRHLGSGLADLTLNLLGAALIIVVAVFLVRRFRRRVRRVLERRNVKNNVPELLTNAITIAAYILVGSVVLRALGANSSSLVTAVGLITAAISLSLQDVLKNFVAGLYLLAEQPFQPGDRIRVAGEEGRVERVDIRTTQLRNDRAEQVLVPNFRVFTEVVGNRSAYRLHQLTLQISGIAMSPVEAETAALMAVQNLPGLSAVPPDVDLLRTTRDAVDLQAILFFTGDTGFRRASVIALHDRFPDATVTVIGT